jgi:predicted  nucleic acid-binding Zn-ribbon protein
MFVKDLAFLVFILAAGACPPWGGGALAFQTSVGHEGLVEFRYQNRKPRQPEGMVTGFLNEICSPVASYEPWNVRNYLPCRGHDVSRDNNKAKKSSKRSTTLALTSKVSGAQPYRPSSNSTVLAMSASKPFLSDFSNDSFDDYGRNWNGNYGHGANYGSQWQNGPNMPLPPPNGNERYREYAARQGGAVGLHADNLEPWAMRSADSFYGHQPQRTYNYVYFANRAYPPFDPVAPWPMSNHDLDPVRVHNDNGPGGYQHTPIDRLGPASSWKNKNERSSISNNVSGSYLDGLSRPTSMSDSDFSWATEDPASDRDRRWYDRDGSQRSYYMGENNYSRDARPLVPNDAWQNTELNSIDNVFQSSNQRQYQNSASAPTSAVPYSIPADNKSRSTANNKEKQSTKVTQNEGIQRPANLNGAWPSTSSNASTQGFYAASNPDASHMIEGSLTSDTTTSISKRENPRSPPPTSLNDATSASTSYWDSVWSNNGRPWPYSGGYLYASGPSGNGIYSKGYYHAKKNANQDTLDKLRNWSLDTSGSNGPIDDTGSSSSNPRPFPGASGPNTSPWRGRDGTSRRYSYLSSFPFQSARTVASVSRMSRPFTLFMHQSSPNSNYGGGGGGGGGGSNQVTQLQQMLDQAKYNLQREQEQYARQIDRLQEQLRDARDQQGEYANEVRVLQNDLLESQRALDRQESQCEREINNFQRRIQQMDEQLDLSESRQKEIQHQMSNWQMNCERAEQQATDLENEVDLLSRDVERLNQLLQEERQRNANSSQLADSLRDIVSFRDGMPQPSGMQGPARAQAPPPGTGISPFESVSPEPWQKGQDLSIMSRGASAPPENNYAGGFAGGSSGGGGGPPPNQGGPTLRNADPGPYAPQEESYAGYEESSWQVEQPYGSSSFFQSGSMKDEEEAWKTVDPNPWGGLQETTSKATRVTASPIDATYRNVPPPTGQGGPPIPPPLRKGNFFEGSSRDETESWQSVDPRPWGGNPLGSTGLPPPPPGANVMDANVDSYNLDSSASSSYASYTEPNAFFQSGSMRDEEEAWRTVDPNPWGGANQPPAPSMSPVSSSTGGEPQMDLPQRPRGRGNFFAGSEKDEGESWKSVDPRPYGAGGGPRF